MRKPISFPRQDGIFSRQAHCDLPEGSFEREFGAEGFFGPATHLYHAHPPTAWTRWEGPLRPRAYDLRAGLVPTSSPWHATPLFSNAACKVRYWVTSGAMDHLVANVDGDELLFVHEGELDLYCDFGHLALRAGDYVTMPRAGRYRVDSRGKSTLLLIEATGEGYRVPDKGLVGDHAIWDPAILDIPALDDAFEAQKNERETSVVMRSRGRLSTVTYPFNPLDTIGYKGDLFPVRINVKDMRPLMSHRYHLPPSAHTTFLARRFVVCTFVPRPAEMDPGALKVPFFHSNNDYDELIFYHHGKFFSRDNIHPGMFTLHAAGFPHGPHPKAFRLAKEREVTASSPQTPHILDEVAVMIDTRDALDIEDAALPYERKEYVNSWTKGAEAP